MDTPEGPLFGSNLDLFIPAEGQVFINKRGVIKTGISAGPGGARAHWVSKYGSVTLNLAGREFPWSGMNEAGLTLSTMYLPDGRMPDPDDRAPLPLPMWAQYVLDTCASLDEVLAVHPVIRPEDSSSSHFLISDAQGNCLAVEWLDGKIASYRNDALPTKAMANAPYWQGADALQRGGKAKWGWSNPGRSTERVATAHWRAMTYDSQQQPDRYRYAFDTLTQHVAASHTKWNVVYDISQRLIMFRSVYRPDVKWLRFADVDFETGVHPQMLEINADLNEDVAGKFENYNANRSRDTFDTFCLRWGVELPEGFAQTLTDHWDTFTKSDG